MQFVLNTEIPFIRLCSFIFVFDFDHINQLLAHFEKLVNRIDQIAQVKQFSSFSFFSPHNTICQHSMYFHCFSANVDILHGNQYGNCLNTFIQVLKVQIEMLGNVLFEMLKRLADLQHLVSNCNSTYVSWNQLPSQQRHFLLPC